jgi:hypothetical protein
MALWVRKVLHHDPDGHEPRRPVTIRSAAPVLLAAVALAGCGETARAPKAATPSGKPIPCPADGRTGRPLDAREVVGLPERRAKALADRHDCKLVAVVRDGERFGITAVYDLRRLQVEVKDGVVTRIVTVG